MAKQCHELEALLTHGLVLQLLDCGTAHSHWNGLVLVGVHALGTYYDGGFMGLDAWSYLRQYKIGARLALLPHFNFYCRIGSDA